MMISSNKMYNTGRVPHLRSPCMSNRSSIDMNDYMRNEDGLVQGQLSDELASTTPISNACASAPTSPSVSFQYTIYIVCQIVTDAYDVHCSPLLGYPVRITPALHNLLNI